MQRRPSRLSASRDADPMSPQFSSADPLTPAQRDWARLVGRLLAEEWGAQHKSDDAHPSTGTGATSEGSSVQEPQ